MSAPPVAGVASWTGSDVLYASDPTSGASVTLWTVPTSPAATQGSDSHQADLDALLRGVADDHAGSVLQSGSWLAGAITEREDGVGSSYLLRQLTPLAGQQDLAVAGYWTTPSGVSVAVVTSATREQATEPSTSADLARVLDDFVVASLPTFTLSAEEVLVLCHLTGLASPPVSPSSYTAESSEEVRDAAHGSALASLLARGLLLPGDEGLRPIPALHESLHLLLEGDRSVLLSVQRPDGDSTVLLGGRRGQLVELSPGEHGTLVLSRTGGLHLHRRYTAWLAPRGTAVSRGAPFRASVDALRAAASVAGTGSSDLSARQVVTLRGLHRGGEELSVLDSTWLEDLDGFLWSVSATEDPTSVLLTPVHTSAPAEALRDVVDFSKP